METEVNWPGDEMVMEGVKGGDMGEVGRAVVGREVVDVVREKEREVGKEWERMEMGMHGVNFGMEKGRASDGMDVDDGSVTEDFGKVGQADTVLEPEKDRGKGMSTEWDEVAAVPPAIKDSAGKSKAPGSKPRLGGFKTNARGTKSGTTVPSTIITPLVKSLTPTV
ncbi:hypothetical protein FRC07_000904 [Ceratobasidium sp. 392]|nr:hypothetical protein FRC07_000904 [Ceratobasidium sp. 392]